MSDQEKKSVRGLREVATLLTLAHGAQPRERHQMASRFARLENERARLECELDMWRARTSATEDKLAKISEQIAALRPLLFEEADQPSGNRQVHRPRRAPASDDAAAPKPSRRMSLEY